MQTLTLYADGCLTILLKGELDHCAAQDAMQSIEELVDEVYGKRWNVTNVPQYFSRQTLVDAIHYLDVYAAERA